MYTTVIYTAAMYTTVIYTAAMYNTVTAKSQIQGVSGLHDSILL